MTLSVRYSTQTATTGTSVAIGTTPVAGNKLLVIYGERSGLGTGNTITGFTKVANIDHNLGNQFERRSIGLWEKTAVGNEASVVSSASGYLHYIELQSDAGEELTFESFASNDDGLTDGATSFSPGSSASLAAIDHFILGIIGHRSDGTGWNATAWSNSFSEIYHFDRAGTHYDCTIAVLRDSTSGVKTTTATITQDSAIGTGHIGLIVTYAVSSSGGTTEVTKSLELRWNTLSVVSKALNIRWNILSAISKALELRWNVLSGSGLTEVVKALNVQWNVRTSISKNLELRWNIRTAVSKAVQARWNVRQAVEKSRTFVWNIEQLETIEKNLTLVWGVTRDILWTRIIPTPVEIDSTEYSTIVLTGVSDSAILLTPQNPSSVDLDPLVFPPIELDA